jgi:hypothetical protein
MLSCAAPNVKITPGTNPIENVNLEFITDRALGTLFISNNLKPRISFWADTDCAFSTKRKPGTNYDCSNFRVFGLCDIAKGNSCKSPEYSEAKFRVLSDRSMIKSVKGRTSSKEHSKK